jgi:ABC-2 type transport system permease protein
MNPVTNAVRLGLARGWIEFRRYMTSAQDMGFNVFTAAAVVAVLYFQRNRTVEGASISVAMTTLPSVLGLMVAQGGFQGAAGALTVQREDGTLVRMKAIPHGMVGYLVGVTVMLALATLASVLIILLPGLFVVPQLTGIGAAWVIPLGLLATLPWGAIVGSLAKSPNALFGLVMLPVVVITGISGIFYPIAALPGWLQAVAQVFPVYWLGLGMRSAFLPDAAVVAEIAGSWRHLEAAVVLGIWAVAGFLLAAPMLRRMARHESGSAMQERRERAMARLG